MEGLGPTQIAKWLTEHKIMCPTAYCYVHNLPANQKPTENPYRWYTATVARILQRLEYLGHTVNFRTTKKSYKSEEKVQNAPSEWMIVENTQPPIIEESVFLAVQNIRKSRHRQNRLGKMGMFSGILFCAGCHGKMYQCRANNFRPEQEYYLCSTYRKDRALCNKTHSIRTHILKEIVTRNLKQAIAYVSQYENEFVEEAINMQGREKEKTLKHQKKSLASAEKRIAELDTIIQRLYEDNICGKLSDERFVKLSQGYEAEQKSLQKTVNTLKNDLQKYEQDKGNVKQFVEIVKKYLELPELNETILREFVDRIEVSHADRNTNTQEIKIVYNFIGAFDFTPPIEDDFDTFVHIKKE